MVQNPRGLEVGEAPRHRTRGPRLLPPLEKFNIDADMAQRTPHTHRVASSLACGGRPFIAWLPRPAWAPGPQGSCAPGPPSPNARHGAKHYRFRDLASAAEAGRAALLWTLRWSRWAPKGASSKCRCILPVAVPSALRVELGIIG